ncbi:MAG: PAS domain-containing protein [Chloroflexi bacterium]|nr:PAS domain-containing protein [Chloroflexota bacterium]
MIEQQTDSFRPPLRWRDGLQTRLIISFFIFLTALVGAVVIVIQIVGRNLLIADNYRLIENNGNKIVSDLGMMLAMTESLTAALANMGESHKPDAEEFYEVIPEMMNIESQTSLIAGGGLWPEPYTFDPNLERSSFFWGRNEAGFLEYYNDYNDPHGPGYHNEEWYVPARYVAGGSCFWSQSYMDPYSFQPMVTCTVPMYNEADQFTGSTTVDLRLEGVRAFFAKASEVTGGYVFAVDRNNKFISYPNEQLTKIEFEDEDGNLTQEFIHANDLAEKELKFTPIAMALESINREIEQLSQQDTNYDPMLAETIAHDSYQINAQEARLVAAILSDPLAERTKDSNLLSQFVVDDDVLLAERVTVSIFHMPDAYWKIVLVTPVSKATATAVSISRTVLLSLLVVVVILSFMAFILLRHYLVKPVQNMARPLQNLSGKPADLSLRLDDSARNELGDLAYWFNRRTQDLQLANEHVRQESKERARTNATLQALLNAIPDDIFQLNRKGGFTEYIPSKEFIPKIFPKSFLGKQFEEVMPTDLAALFQSQTSGLFADGRMRVFEYSHTTEKGKVHFEARINKIDDAAALLIVRDITKRKEVQISLVTYANELERSNREYQDFAYVASHDLQEPLRKIQAFGDRLTTRYAQHLDERGLMYLDRMQNAAERMQTLIVDLLTFSRVTTQAEPFTNVDLNEVLAHVLVDLDTKIEEISAQIELSELAQIEADGTQMRQLFQNLISNALKFSQEDVSPVIQINGRLLPGSNLYEIRVKDNGIGFEPQYQERIFQVFQRLHGRFDYEGTGVGLAICKRIIERHLGVIAAESSLNEGATFIIQLPLKQP